MYRIQFQNYKVLCADQLIATKLVPFLFSVGENYLKSFGAQIYVCLTEISYLLFKRTLSWTWPQKELMTSNN